MLSSLYHDVRYGWRMLRKTPAVTLLAVLTIGAGVGVNSTLFSLVDMLWLRPLPVSQPERLVRIYTGSTDPARDPFGDSSYPDFTALRAQASSFSGLAVLERRGSLMQSDDATLMLTTAVISDDFFQVFEVQPELGRAYNAADGRNGVQAVLLSYGFWSRQFHSDPTLIGRTLVLTGRQVVVLGVLPRAFRPSDSSLVSDVWMPFTVWGPMDNRRLEQRGRRTFEIYGRRRPGVTVQQAAAEVQAIGARLQSAFPQTNGNYRMSVEPEAAARQREHGRTAALLLGIGALVLLIACTNVANLLLARAEQRQKEIATRMALGGTRGRTIRQLLIESLLLAVLGGAAALLMAGWLIALLPSVMPMESFGRNAQPQLDLRAALFAATAALGCVLLFGVAPALSATRVNLTRALKEGGSQDGRRPGRARTAMVVVQVALSLVLAVCAGLLARTVSQVQKVEPGFDARRNLLIADAVPAASLRDPAQIRSYIRALRENLAAIPGVTSTAVAVRLPFWHSGGGRRVPVFTEREIAVPDHEGLQIGMAEVGDGYFETIGTRLLRGRGFTAEDVAQDRKVLVVNELLARRLWGRTDVVGERIRLWKRDGDWYEVAGVAEDGKYSSITERSRAYLFLPLVHENSELAVIAATAAEPGPMVPLFRRALREVNAAVPVPRVLTLREHMLEAIYQQRMMARLVGLLGGLGLALAGVGLYGLLSMLVGTRTREIGIRLALGAGRRQIFNMVVARSLRLAGIGVAIGLAASLFASRTLKAFLFGVAPLDATSYLAAVLLLLAVSIAASALPAMRATQVDPMRSLRSE